MKKLFGSVLNYFQSAQYLALTSIAPLVTFRILFGALMLVGTARFMASGWIEKLYLLPKFHFKYYGFGWVQSLNETGIYLLFWVMLLSAFCIMIGLWYRWATLAFFLTFTYSELIDATNYLNHHYLVGLFALLLIFLPAHQAFSLDTKINPALLRLTVPKWTIHILIFQLVVVYTFAGIAKLNYDWLFRAMPLAIWLPERSNMPILGYFFGFPLMAYLFCWAGAIYDLTIAYFLLFKKTRPYAYCIVLVFHSMTYLLFNIGLFPFIMTLSTLIFFSADFHQKLLGFFGFRPNAALAQSTPEAKGANPWLVPLLSTYILIQILMPLRHFLYPNNVLWTEEGYRWSWRVMVLEKSGQAIFKLEDLDSGRKTEIINGYYLTQFQEKQLCIQPDFILQFAHFLKKEFQEKHGINHPKITADVRVVVNGRPSQPLIDATVNLATVDNLTQWIMEN